MKETQQFRGTGKHSVQRVNLSFAIVCHEGVRAAFAAKALVADCFLDSLSKEINKIY
jgi:hypothetical protein